MSIEHTTLRGITFTCENRDLSTPIEVEGAKHIHPANLAAEVAEFIGWYTLEVYPNVSSFQGFDNLRFDVGDVKYKIPLVGNVEADTVVVIDGSVDTLDM